MRVLHLIDALSPWGGPCTFRLASQTIARLQSNGWHEHEVLLIGTHADVREAAMCGLGTHGSIWPLRRRTLAAVKGLRKWLMSRMASGENLAPSVIHAWSSSAGALAAVTAPSMARVVTPHPLAADPERSGYGDRESVRDRWHEEDGIDRDDFVLGLIGEPAECFDARTAMHIAARTGLSSRRVRMLISGREQGRPEQHRFLARLDLEDLIVQDEAIMRPWKMLRGLDAAIILAPVAVGLSASQSLSSLPVLMAQAAGVPVLAEAHAPTSGLVDHDRTGLTFPLGEVNAACERVARLYDDRTLAARLVREAAEQVARRFSIEKFCSRLDEAYRHAIEQHRSEYLDLADTQ